MNTRRQFLLSAAAGFSAVLAGRSRVSAAENALPAAPVRGPAIEPDRVKAFVIAAHGDLEKTGTLLEATPALVNATWDWGDGDFETALGGASHMGRRDIALLLLERGARLDMFAAAMLGRLDVLRPMLEAYPHLFNTPGPHRIPLVAHARAGGAEAAGTLAWLEGLKQPAA